MFIAVLIILIVLILSVVLAIKPIQGNQRSAGLTLIAATQILAGIITVAGWGNLIEETSRGRLHFVTGVSILPVLILSLILISTGLGLLRLKKWAQVISFISTPLIYGFFSLMICLSILGFPLGPLISLCIVIATVIFELVYIKQKGIQSSLKPKDKPSTQEKRMLKELALSFLVRFKEVKKELAVIGVCLLILFLLWLLKI